jgi:hypothetical protein
MTTTKPHTSCRNYPNRERCSTGVNDYCDDCLLGPDPLADPTEDHEDEDPATTTTTKGTTMTLSSYRFTRARFGEKFPNLRPAPAAPLSRLASLGLGDVPTTSKPGAYADILATWPTDPTNARPIE